MQSWSGISIHLDFLCFFSERRLSLRVVITSSAIRIEDVLLLMKEPEQTTTCFKFLTNQSWITVAVWPWTRTNGYVISTDTCAVVGEIYRSFTWVNVILQQWQVKVLHSEFLYCTVLTGKCAQSIQNKCTNYAEWLVSVIYITHEQLYFVVLLILNTLLSEFIKESLFLTESYSINVAFCSVVEIFQPVFRLNV